MPHDATSDDLSKTAKGARTKARILEVSLRLFRDQGYDATSMRAIAKEAGVSVGNAYYYFASKEHLVQAFYADTHKTHRAAVQPILDRERTFEARLRGVVHERITTAEPYHALAGLLFKTAADPNSPLNPFSADSSATRDDAVAMLAEVIDGSDLTPSEELRRELPDLLWLFLMSTILYWIHDASPERQRTRALIDDGCKFVSWIVRAADHPMLGSARASFLQLMGHLRAVAQPAATASPDPPPSEPAQ